MDPYRLPPGRGLPHLTCLHSHHARRTRPANIDIEQPTRTVFAIAAMLATPMYWCSSAQKHGQLGCNCGLANASFAAQDEYLVVDTSHAFANAGKVWVQLCSFT